MRALNRPFRAGQSLVEFAVVSLVLYMLLAAILTFGHMLYVAQGLQGAADLAAREISRTPLPAVKSTGAFFEFNDAMAADDVRQRIYDEAFLVIDLDNFFANFPAPPDQPLSVFEHLVPTLPLLNQQLIPLMIVETPANGATGRLLRYPGALIQRAQNIDPPSSVTYGSWVRTDLAVKIPMVVDRSGSGTETIRWLDVVEEIKANGAISPFSVQSSASSSQQGIVALRMNYPFQSAAMSGFRPDPNASDFPFESNISRFNTATNAVNEPDPSIGLWWIVHCPSQLRWRGDLYRNLWRQVWTWCPGAFGKTVRPFRRVISAQAIYRREIFSN